jgi:tryptophanyl-tRNA synthetase
MTVAYDPKEMQNRIFDAACINMACGLDPEKCRIFVQSQVVQHTELAWILNCLTPIGEAMRMTQFKEKSEQHKNNINLGLLTYPILQAADILLYRPRHVPVGEDQVQHIELSRDIARKFNHTFGEYFPEPTALLTQAARIKGLDGEHKMSKSRNNYIAMTDEPDEVWNKLRGAFTDPARLRKNDPGHPEICNIFSLHKIYSPPQDVVEIDHDCRAGKLGCVDCKKKLAARINAENAPIIERYKKLVADPDIVHAALRQGAEAARAVATETMDAVHKLTGLR